MIEKKFKIDKYFRDGNSCHKCYETSNKKLDFWGVLGKLGKLVI